MTLKINIDLEELKECEKCGVIFKPKDYNITGSSYDYSREETYSCPVCKQKHKNTLYHGDD